MERIVTVHIEKLPEGYFLATSEQVPGLVAQGRTTVPNHPGEMPEGTLRAILKQAGITPEDFLNL